ncbi:MAG: apolipoprotein N-acyltransferase [Pirellulales bacterium]
MDKRQVWMGGLASGLMLWLALPPCGWAWLGWFAPLPWIGLVARETLPGKRPYWAAWGASSIFWLVYLQGVRLAHPALYGGWLALSLYVAAYAPLFLALARFAVHRWRWPLPLAAPVVWTGLELVRGRFLGGFTGGMIGNTQTQSLTVLQAADLGGAYGLSFAMVLVGACVVAAARTWLAKSNPENSQGRMGQGAAAAVWLSLALLTLVALVAYGRWRLSTSPLAAATTDEATGQQEGGVERPLRAVLIQESMDTIFEHNPERNADGFAKYVKRTEAACADLGPIDVVVWPESMFSENSVDFLLPAGLTIEQLEPQQRLFDGKCQFVSGRMAKAYAAHGSSPPPLIAGTVTVAIDRTGRTREYNSALLLEAPGRVADRYYKRHLVMFGEYIPLGGWFPWVYSLAGMPGALSEGEEEKVFTVRGWRLAPNICFETMVPQRIRGQVRELAARGESPDLLVSLTNDGWFWGSALLDMHLQAAVLRAVEVRRPMVVAANTGLSASIDGDGRVLARGPRREGGTIAADVRRDGRSTWYVLVGDAPWQGCAGLCLVLGLAQVAAWWRTRRQHRS